MKAIYAVLLAGSVSLLSPACAAAQDAAKNDTMGNCPMHEQHSAADPHHETMLRHGDQAMGFPHAKTTHHFLLEPNGGTIQVEVNDPNDKVNAAAIRTHLSHIAGSFASGDFSAPMFVHDALPPGVTTMQILKASIHYQYEETPSGGRVRISSADPVAVAAVHDFLRFQISEHQTGDPLSAGDSHKAETSHD